LGLFTKHGLHKGQFFELKREVGEYLIGRGPQASIHITDQGVSKRHASIAFRNGYWFLNDTNSANGTYLNGYRIVENVLRQNDLIVIGMAEMQLVVRAEVRPTGQHKTVDPSLSSTIVLPNIVLQPPDDAHEVLPLDIVERKYIRRALVTANGDRTLAASLLGISVDELEDKLALIQKATK
jgi:pSer/pThr/pTyr-binding forkhead associated (FHA) protein